METQKLDKIIALADKAYDALGIADGDYKKYHTLAKHACALEGVKYNTEEIDKRTIELAVLELDKV